jgi:hypothetical protein
MCPCIQVDLDKDLSATEQPAGWSHNYCGLFWKVGIGMDVFVSVETILMIVLLMVHSEFSGLYTETVSTTKIR